MKKEEVGAVGITISLIGFFIGFFAYGGNPKEIYYLSLISIWCGIGMVWGNLLQGP